MIFAVAFFLNTAANFVFGVVLSALLGPAEFGRYATVALMAGTLSAGLFEWLRQSSIRYSGDAGDARTAASLDAGYFFVMALMFGAFAVAYAFGQTFGLPLAAFALTPLLTLALSRVDFAGAYLRTREKPGAFALLYGLRQGLAFTIVLAVAFVTRNSALTIAALAFCALAPAIAVGAFLRTPGARLNQASRERLVQFFIYAKPIVLSLVLYQLIVVVNRHAALVGLGADATGKFSLAVDMGQRLFLALNTLPEFLLFQYALRREREDGRAAAERQIGLNMTITLALLAPLTAGYVAMRETFEALIVPAAYRGDYATLSVALAPGFLAFCAISSMLNPVFQLAQRTWPTILAAGCAFLANLAAISFTGAAQSTLGLAWASSAGLTVGCLAAAALALRNPRVRPALKDVAVIAAASVAMMFAVRPLDASPSHALAAIAAVAGGGALYGAALLLFDVGGSRGWVASFLSSGRWRQGFARG